MNWIREGVQIVILTLITSTVAAPGIKVFHIGNSLTDQAYGMHDVAKGNDYDPIVWGRFMIPGAPIHWLWSHQADGIKEVKGATVSGTNAVEWLKTMQWDVVVLQSFPQNGDNAASVTESGGNFAQAAYQGNPNCQVYVFGGHVSANDNWTTQLPRLSTVAVDGAAGISARFPNNKTVLVIPVIQAIDRVRVLAGQGSVPGISSFSALFESDGGHLNNNGRYLEALVHFATIYKQNPTGAVTSFYGNNTVSASWAATAQKIAWEVVTSYLQSGVTTTAVVPYKPEIKSSLSQGNSVVLVRSSNLLGQMIRVNSSNVSAQTTKATGIYLFNNGTMSKKGLLALDNVN